jgi:hypothetical protein
MGATPDRLILVVFGNVAVAPPRSGLPELMQGTGQTVDVAGRGAKSDAGSYGAWEWRAPPGLELGAEAGEVGVGDSEQPGDQRVSAKAAVADADRVLGAEDGGDQRMGVAVEGERGHADAVDRVGPPQPQRVQARHGAQAVPQACSQRALVCGDGVHADLP